MSWSVHVGAGELWSSHRLPRTSPHHPNDVVEPIRQPPIRERLSRQHLLLADLELKARESRTIRFQRRVPAGSVAVGWARPDLFARVQAPQHISTSMLTALPPPRQRLAMPRLPPVRFSWLMSVTSTRAPLAPIG